MLSRLFTKKVYLIALFITLLAFFLRIHNLDQLYVFGADEEYQANIVKTLIKDFHPIWIGVSAANTGFYLGPFWSYFTYIWQKVFGGDPLITAYAASFIGAITAFVIFYTGLKMFRFRVGVVASLLYACLPLIVFFDQKYWNPTLVPLLSVTMVYSLYRFKDNQYYLLLFAVSYGLVFHTHLSLAPFLLLALISFKKGVKKIVLASSLLLFLVTISPLIVFDYFHNWSNITTPLRLPQIASVTQINYLDKVESLGSAIMRLWYLPPFSINANEVLSACLKYRSTPVIFSALIFILIGIFLFNKQTWIKENTRILSLGIILIAISYVFFPGRSDEYYLLGLFPLLLFIPGLVWKRYITVGIVSIVCVLGIFSILSTYNPYGLKAKRQIIAQISSVVGSQPYYLEEKGECHQYEGWRYLFATYSRAPERSSIDSTFGWLYPEEITNTPEKFSVEITGHDINHLGFTYKVNRL